MTAAIGSIVRRIFPSVTKCTRCGLEGHRHSGSSREGVIQYRTCLHCSEKYRVCPIGEERYDGGMQSVIVIW